jgi:hypothetical protein
MTNMNNTPGRGQLLGFVAFVPILGLLAVVAVSVVNMRPAARTMQWGGLSLVLPVQSEVHFQDNDEMVFEAGRPAQIVRAAIGGTVACTPGGMVKIVDAATAVEYRGITTLDVAAGQVVRKGDPIGRLAFDRQDKPGGQLRLKLLRHGSYVVPTGG